MPRVYRTSRSGAYGGPLSSGVGYSRQGAGQRWRPRYRKIRRLSLPALYRSIRVLQSELRPEMKQVRLVLGIDGTTYAPTTTAVTCYPNSGTNWSVIDTAPGQGTGSQQRVGNSYRRRGYNMDLKFFMNDVNVMWRFVVFRWKMEDSPDAAVWNNPLSLPNGNWFSPFTPADSTNWADVVWQSSGVFTTTYTGLVSTAAGSLPASNGNNQGFVAIRKFIKFNEQVDVAQDSILSSTTGTVSSVTSFKGRLYWIMMTNNASGSDLSVAGTWTEYFTDI